VGSVAGEPLLGRDPGERVGDDTGAAGVAEDAGAAGIPVDAGAATGLGRDGGTIGGGALLGRAPGICAFWVTFIDFRATAVAVLVGVLGRALIGAGDAAAIRDDAGEAGAQRKPGVDGPGPGTASNCGAGPAAGGGSSPSRNESPAPSKLRSVFRPQKLQSQATSKREPLTSMLCAGARSRTPSLAPTMKPAST
jgi:hypothetical protein